MGRFQSCSRLSNRSTTAKASTKSRRFFRENFDKTDYDIVREFWQREYQRFRAATTAAAATTSGATGQTPANTAASNQAGTAQTGNTQTGNSQATNSQSAQPSTRQASQMLTTQQQSTGTSNTAGQPAASQTGAAAQTSNNFEDTWRRIVHNGVVPNSTAAVRTVSANTSFLSQPEPKPTGAGELEISIRPDPNIYDGRFANNGWLQELPKPLTKITWDNVALVSREPPSGCNDRDRDTNDIPAETQARVLIRRGGKLFSD